MSDKGLLANKRVLVVDDESAIRDMLRMALDIAGFELLRDVMPGEAVFIDMDGQLHTQPRPTPRHLRAASRLDRIIGRHFDDGDDGPGAGGSFQRSPSWRSTRIIRWICTKLMGYRDRASL